MPSIYMERDYCDKCLTVHWVEKYFKSNGQRQTICHGEKLYPEDSPTHYVKSAHNGGKGFYLIKKSKHWKPDQPAQTPLPLAWQMAKDAELPADVDF